MLGERDGGRYDWECPPGQDDAPGCECHGDVYCSDCGATLGRAEATIADIRDRLRVLEPMVCEGCGCAARANPSDVDDSRLCVDCDVEHWPGRLTEDESVEAACLSVGLRALCGRKLLEGC